MYTSGAGEGVLYRMEPSSGPDMGVFNRFKERWAFIDQSHPDPPTPDELPPTLLNKRDTLLQEWAALFNTSHPAGRLQGRCWSSSSSAGWRERRPEGEVPANRAPSTRVRWMARAIYAAKITLFAAQLGGALFAVELSSLRRFTSSSLEVYVTRWFEAPVAAFAPANDLKTGRRPP
ncbi:hypothetical protein GWK47_050976 [Chionoecetes opilio]|uniref:Uncharacterized protein n=1 Tax=Chionoecetes opilio TaxID=41210 RepID=A0A8J4Y7W1_CHIOP|nr:hypothetical protein GWK47_050976 [Chionoecetes opilio]